MKINRDFIRVFLCSIILCSGAYAEKRIVEFSVPGNQYCDGNHMSEISISISNLSNNSTSVILDLYKIDGSALLLAGTSNNGIISDIVLGQANTLSGKSTKAYHLPFQDQHVLGAPCSDKIYHGRITVDSLDGRIVAAGSIAARNLEYFRGAATILINEGKPF